MILDGESLPPETLSVDDWAPYYSVAVSPEVLLILVNNLLNNTTQYTERSVDDYGMVFMQGLSAIAAGFFGSDHDREVLELNSYLLIQSSVLQNYLMEL